ncbi:hypothetical protein BH581_01185 [Vibrio splendidus]|nr:hypothetical protein BH581_01185 [Vibrio splendidus]
MNITLNQLYKNHIEEHHFSYKNNLTPFQVKVIESIEKKEFVKFKRKGKLDYSFSNETVEI